MSPLSEIAWLLAVDIGNTGMKFGAFRGADLSAEGKGLPQPVAVTEISTHAPDFNDLFQWVRRTIPEAAHARQANGGSPPVAFRVASVHRPSEQALARWRAEHFPAWHYRNLTRHDFPIRLDVELPDRVGIDRLAAAMAANGLREPTRPALVIDAGSAITIDLVGVDGTFHGGAILAGMRMAALNLARDTDLLPLVEVGPKAPPPAVVGRSTGPAILSGVYWGTVGAVRELTARMAEEARERFAADPQLFFSGGDGAKVQPWVAPDATYVPHIALAGIAAAARRTV